MSNMDLNTKLLHVIKDIRFQNQVDRRIYNSKFHEVYYDLTKIAPINSYVYMLIKHIKIKKLNDNRK